MVLAVLTRVLFVQEGTPLAAILCDIVLLELRWCFESQKVTLCVESRTCENPQLQ